MPRAPLGPYLGPRRARLGRRSRSPPPGATRRGSTPRCCSPHVLGVDRARARSPTPAAGSSPTRRARSRTSRAGAGASASRSPTSSARKGFRRIDLAVDPRVLIPRPETEHAGRGGARRCRAGARVVDVGTGLGRDRAGAEGRAAGPARWSRTDVSADALDVARANARAARARRRVRARRPARRRRRRLDAVVSNPPYVADGRRALRAGDRALRAARGAVRRARTGSTSSARLAPGRGATARASSRSRSARARPPRSRSCCAARASATVERVRDLAGHRAGRGRAGDDAPRRRGVRGAASPRGGVAVFPADTVYGLACDPENARRRSRACTRSRAARRTSPRAVMFFDAELALAALPELGPRTRALLARLLPGGVTLLLPNPRGASRSPAGRTRRRSGCACPTLPALARASCAAGAAELGNLAGGADARRLDEVPEAIRARRRPRARRRRAAGHAVDGRSTCARYEADGDVGDRARRAPCPRGHRRRRTRVAWSACGRVPSRAAPLVEPPMTDLQPDYFERPLAEVDPEVAEAIDHELERQQRTLEMIASENFVPAGRPRVPGQRAHEQVRRGLSRASATTAAASTSTSSSSSRSTARRRCSAPSTPTSSRTPARRPTRPSTTRCCSPATRSWASRCPHGGHLSHGMKINVSGPALRHRARTRSRREDHRIDMDEVERIAQERRPKLLLAGWSAYPRFLDFERFRAIADEVGALPDGRHGALRRARRRRPAPEPGARTPTSSRPRSTRRSAAPAAA